MNYSQLSIISLPKILDKRGNLSFFEHPTQLPFVKLKYIDSENTRRREIAERYWAEIKNPNIILPELPAERMEHVWHLFVIRTKERQKLQNYLTENGVQTLVHYPVPPHKQEAYKELNHLSFPITEYIHKEVVSLPMSPVMTEDEVTLIIEAVNTYS